MEKCKYPLASLIVVFYKQEQFVQDTVLGALSQTYPNLEIILSDDNSPDGTFEAIQNSVKDYKGPHKIILNRNKTNMGLVPHFNKAMFELSHGEVIFLNGGDDISLPRRVSMGMEVFLHYPDVTAVTFSRIFIDENGNENGRQVGDCNQIISLSDMAYIKQPSFMSKGVALSLRRIVLGEFGPMSDDCQTEDSVLRFRALLLGKTYFNSQLGLKYRVHHSNMSRNIFKLRTDLIAKQYRRDLEKNRSKMPARLYSIINKKIDFYIQYRTSHAAESLSHFPMSWYYRIKKRLLLLFFERTVLEEQKKNSLNGNTRKNK